MKPTLLYIATLVVIACAAFTSCEQKSNQSPAHVDSLSIQYSWECSREHEDIVIDTIPARLYLKARYLIKPGIEVDKDKMIRIGSSMSIQNTTEFSEYSDSIPEPEFELRDYYRVTFCPIHSVRGNKLKAYLELANEEASTLDYTVQRRASDPSIGEFVKND